MTVLFIVDLHAYPHRCINANVTEKKMHKEGPQRDCKITQPCNEHKANYSFAFY